MLTMQSTIEELMLEHPKRKWELHRGRLREKPTVAEPHNVVISRLAEQITKSGLDSARFSLRVDMGKLKREESTYYIPDLAIVPAVRSIRGGSTRLEIFRDPLPFVAEVWSPSTGDYDVDEKLPEYRARGDLEIWRVHPYDFTITSWRRDADWTYLESVHDRGLLALHVLPEIVVDLDELFR